MMTSNNETAEAFAQLAIATAADHGAVAALSATNARLTTQLETGAAQIAVLIKEVNELKNKTKPEGRTARPVKLTDNDNYCWSHGHQVHAAHTSVTCRDKKRGHKDEATKDDTMGGVKWGKV